MDTMKVIYKILEILDGAMDNTDFDIKDINNTVFGISEVKWVRILEIMIDKHFITGIKLHKDLSGGCMIADHDPRITFEGLEYLAENSNTAKIINAAKILKDVVPFT